LPGQCRLTNNKESIMAIDLVTLGKRLRKAREDRGTTQEAAAEALGVPRTAIVQMEAGNRSISTLELVQLADLYERPIAEFFAEGPLPELTEDDPLVALLRVSDNFKSHPDVKSQVSRCVELCREGAELENLLGKKARGGPPFYNLPEPRNAMDAVRQGTQVAAEERSRLGLGDGPFHALPDVLSNQGVRTASVDLPNDMSGLFLRHPAIGMVILVNHRHPRPRKRFSYAHEYAHALLDRNRTALVSTRENSKDRSETRANAFAAAILMPEGGVRSYLESLDKGSPSRQTQLVYDLAGSGVEASGRSVPGSQTIGYQDVASLARYFGVSYQAAAFRLQALNIVNQSERESLIEQEELGNRYLRLLNFVQAIDSPDEAKDGEDDQQKELVSHVAYLAIEAFRRDEISRGKLLELSKTLQIPGKELLALAQGTL
jgi:Zn-dependent peptidase ImmA (M78 family)/transcriptional regulator with XRE-family HTH domain